MYIIFDLPPLLSMDNITLLHLYINFFSDLCDLWFCCRRPAVHRSKDPRSFPESVSHSHKQTFDKKDSLSESKFLISIEYTYM